MKKGAGFSEMCAEMLRFPECFFWGTVTSAYQVEGNNTNSDWWEWEKRKGAVRDGSVSGPACLHYERFEEDIEILKSLGTNAHRLSVEWSRLEPDEGRWDPEAQEHYTRVLSLLRANGIVPFLTLHHCTIPLWVARLGGWESERAVEAFERYVRRAVQSFGPYVQHWVTVNAPVLYAYRGYVAGLAPPGARNRRKALRVCRNLMRAHARAYHAIHEEETRLGLTAQVGLAKNFRIFDPLRENAILDQAAARMRDDLFNSFVPDSLHEGIMVSPLGFNRYVPGMERCFDFIGVNYYTREMTRFRLGRPLHLFGEGSTSGVGTRSSQGHEIYPEGLYRILESVAKYGKPVYITENGVATDDPAVRCRFIVSHLRQVYDAMQLGGDVRGYFYCSLMDGFEWHEGYSARTGLIEVNRHNLERRVKDSGYVYSRICAENGLSAEIIRQYCPEDVP